MRACLNTLQLLSRSGRPVRVADVRAATAGHKDQTGSVFSLWQDLFSDRVCYRMLPYCHVYHREAWPFCHVWGGPRCQPLAGCYECIHKA